MTSVPRRRVLQYGLSATVTTLTFNLGRYRLFAGCRQEYSARAIDLVSSSTVIDMLCLLSLNFRKSRYWMQHPERFTREDWQRFRDSGIRVMHPAIGMSDVDAYDACVQFMASWNGFLANHHDLFMRIDSAGDLERVRQSEKVGVLLGLQNSSHFRNLNDISLFFSLGQRVSQLTYNARNLIGSGATERSDGGLSDFGVAVVERMNKVGMAVDVSHSGDRTTLDAMSASEQPVLITHSNCRALNPDQPRCKTDEAITRMASTGGVMGITAVRMFVKADEPTTIEHVLDHFDHVRDLVGAQHLGVGSDIDLDGYDDMPEDLNRQLRAGYKSSYQFRDKIDVEGLDHPKRMFDLAEGLIRRGYSDDEIQGILGGNFMRVLKQIWAPAESR